MLPKITTKKRINHRDDSIYKTRNGSGIDCISDHAIQDAFVKYHKLGRVPIKCTVHTLRYSFATHLMEDGVSIFYIQKILGHTTLLTTMLYLRIAITDVMKTQSPLDTLMNKEEKRKSKGTK